MRKGKRIVSILLILLLMQLSVFSEISFEEEQYIVQFAPQVSLDKVDQWNGAKGYSSKRINLINGIVFKGSPNALEALSQNFKVVSIEPDQLVYLIDSVSQKAKPGTAPPPIESIPWGIKQTKADQVWIASTGLGVKVAVIDTGIDLIHSDLGVSGGVNFVTRVNSFNDDNGHGTHVAGIIAARDNEIGVVGMAPNANLYAVKVLDSRGSGYLSNVVLGIEWAINNGMDIINMSLGSDSPSTSLATALDKAKTAGIISIAAAGNDSSAIDYPGAYGTVIAVGATESNNKIAYFSSFGAELDVVAPGVGIYSTYKGNSYKTLNGTSMASPHVAGLAALYLEDYPSGTFDNFRAKLVTTSFDLGTSGFDPYYGFGLIDAINMLK